jgi:hypothetical protein
VDVTVTEIDSCWQAFPRRSDADQVVLGEPAGDHRDVM